MEGISGNEKYYHLAKIHEMHPFSPFRLPSDGPIFQSGPVFGLPLPLNYRHIDSQR